MKKDDDKWEMQISPTELAVRGPEKEDLNFIWSSWLKSYRNSEFARTVPNDIYYNYHQALINQILLNPANSVTVLTDPKDSNQIIGFIAYCVTKPIIYYIYVKQIYRKAGLGRYLFEGVRKHYANQLDSKDFITTCTHKPRRWARFEKRFNLTYNPYITGDTVEGSKDATEER